MDKVEAGSRINEFLDYHVNNTCCVDDLPLIGNIHEDGSFCVNFYNEKTGVYEGFKVSFERDPSTDFNVESDQADEDLANYNAMIDLSQR